MNKEQTKRVRHDLKRIAEIITILLKALDKLSEDAEK